ncbi:hypothetical protein TWF718_005773 [Orbilia javanica]|uniref:Uncharacterized protein n=1 Tax=Orbilia javanica TaxID=47235 RepID=A0AAN8N437_9PEZI
MSNTSECTPSPAAEVIPSRSTAHENESDHNDPISQTPVPSNTINEVHVDNKDKMDRDEPNTPRIMLTSIRPPSLKGLEHQGPFDLTRVTAYLGLSAEQSDDMMNIMQKFWAENPDIDSNPPVKERRGAARQRLCDAIAKHLDTQLSVEVKAAMFAQKLTSPAISYLLYEFARESRSRSGEDLELSLQAEHSAPATTPAPIPELTESIREAPEASTSGDNQIQSRKRRLSTGEGSDRAEGGPVSSDGGPSRRVRRRQTPRRPEDAPGRRLVIHGRDEGEAPGPQALPEAGANNPPNGGGVGRRFFRGAVRRAACFTAGALIYVALHPAKFGFGGPAERLISYEEYYNSLNYTRAT